MDRSHNISVPGMILIYGSHTQTLNPRDNIAQFQVRYDTIQYDKIRHDAIQYSLFMDHTHKSKMNIVQFRGQNDTLCYDMIRYVTLRCDTIYYVTK